MGSWTATSGILHCVYSAMGYVRLNEEVWPISRCLQTSWHSLSHEQLLSSRVCSRINRSQNPPLEFSILSHHLIIQSQSFLHHSKSTSQNPLNCNHVVLQAPPFGPRLPHRRAFGGQRRLHLQLLLQRRLLRRQRWLLRRRQYRHWAMLLEYLGWLDLVLLRHPAQSCIQRLRR